MDGGRGGSGQATCKESTWRDAEFLLKGKRICEKQRTVPNDEHAEAMASERFNIQCRTPRCDLLNREVSRYRNEIQQGPTDLVTNDAASREGLRLTPYLCPA